MNSKIPIVLITTTSTFTVMLLYETAKEVIFKGTLTPWQSHWITIIFTTMISLVVTLFSINNILSLRERSATITLKEEKIKSIKQVMRVVHHHVNNLANNLTLVKLEIEEQGALSGETLDTLNNAIEETAEEMKRLGGIDDPFDENFFKIRV